MYQSRTNSADEQHDRPPHASHPVKQRIWGSILPTLSGPSALTLRRTPVCLPFLRKRGRWDCCLDSFPPSALYPRRTLAALPGHSQCARGCHRTLCHSDGTPAALFESLVNNHPFIDGNKRVGFAAMHTFLLVNGFDLEVSTRAGFEFMMMAIADGKFRFALLHEWIATHIVPLPR